jgi:hypothetical protein
VTRIFRYPWCPAFLKLTGWTYLADTMSEFRWSKVDGSVWQYEQSLQLACSF